MRIATTRGQTAFRTLGGARGPIARAVMATSLLSPVSVGVVDHQTRWTGPSGVTGGDSPFTDTEASGAEGIRSELLRLHLAADGTPDEQGRYLDYCRAVFADAYKNTNLLRALQAITSTASSGSAAELAVEALGSTIGPTPSRAVGAVALVAILRALTQGDEGLQFSAVAAAGDLPVDTRGIITEWLQTSGADALHPSVEAAAAAFLRRHAS